MQTLKVLFLNLSTKILVLCGFHVEAIKYETLANDEAYLGTIKTDGYKVIAHHKLFGGFMYDVKL